jgi:hypothetical protein
VIDSEWHVWGGRAAVSAGVVVAPEDLEAKAFGDCH